MNASRFIIDSLQQSGIKTVFGLPGVHALGLWKAVEESQIHYVGFRHEQSAAHAADGFGRATGKPGVVLLSTGPGALNSLSALGEAKVSSSPVISIASGIPSHLIGKGKGYLHEGGDLVPAYASVTKFSARAESAEQIPELLSKALEISLSGRPGPTMLEIPADFLDSEIDARFKALEVPSVDPTADEIDEAGLLLGLAARPLIIAGAGVLRSGATDELIQLAEKLNAPVLTTFMGKGSFPETHPLCVGALMRQPEAADLLRSSDALLSVGARFSAMVTNNWKLELPAQHIQIDIEPSQLGLNYPVRLGIVADAKPTLIAIAKAVSDKRAEEVIASRAGHVESAKKVRTISFERARSEGPDEMAWLTSIRSAIPSDAITVHDMTVPSYWSAPFFEITKPGTFHYPYGYGSLGFSFPAAIGVAAGNPGKAVLCFSGDGGFQYHARELATISQYGIPVVCMVFNDRSWGVLRAFSQARYETQFGLDLPGPDFQTLAKAYDIESHLVGNPDEIEDTLKSAFDEPRPMLIEIPGKWKLPPPSAYYGK